MLTPKIREFLEAGVHFGHQTRRWNPKMKPFIFAARNGIYIIDLQKTINALEQAKKKMVEVTKAGRPVLFVGTKKQAREVILEEAPRCNGYYVVERWLGGMLTNFDTIKASIKKLKDIERMRETGELNKFTKKERSRIDKQSERLESILGGIKDMNYLPGLVVIIDAKKEAIAVAEASKLGIPIIGILDTNADPDPIDFPIAGNDDAIKSIRVLLRELVDAASDAQTAVTAREMEMAREAERPQPHTTYVMDADEQEDGASAGKDSETEG